MASFLILLLITTVGVFDSGVLASGLYSCEGRCNEPSNYSSCGCDVRCLTLGDCCVDFKKSCRKIYLEAKSEREWLNSLQSLKRPKYFNKFSECVFVPSFQNGSEIPLNLTVVNSCPKNSGDRMAVVNCTDGAPTLPPVESYIGIVFKNVYCALCHGMNIENVCPWRRIPNENEILGYMSRRNTWAYKLCQENVHQGSCDNEKDDTGNTKTCNSYVKPVFSAHTKLFYKNEFCASCHDENVTSSQLIHLNYTWTGKSVYPSVSINGWCGNDTACIKTESGYLDQGHFQQNCGIPGRKQTEATVCKICTCMDDLMANLTVTKTCSRNMQITYIDISSAKLELVVNRFNYMRVLKEIKITKALKNECSIYVTVAIYRKRKGSSLVKYAGIAGTNQTWRVTVKNESHFACTMTCFWERRNLDANDFEVLEPCKHGNQDTLNDKNGIIPPLKEDKFEVSDDFKSICTCLGSTNTFAAIATYMHLVFSIISVFSLVVVIWIHMRFPRLQNLYGFCLVCLSVTLAASFISSVIQIMTDFVSFDVAIVFTIIRHYIWLSVFAWGTVIILHVYRSFAVNVVANKISVLTIKSQSYRYATFAWGVPIPFVITGVICHFRLDNFEYTRHWLTSNHALPFFIFIIPALCLSLFGISLFFATLSKMKKRSKGTEEMWKHTTDVLFIGLRLQLTLGVPWMSFLFLLVSNHPLKLPIVSTVNSLQGIFIMVAFVTTKKIKHLIKNRNRTHSTTL